MEANKYFLLGITIASVYSRAVRGELPPKILDSPPKVVSNLCNISLIELIFTKSTQIHSENKNFSPNYKIQHS